MVGLLSKYGLCLTLYIISFIEIPATSTNDTIDRTNDYTVPDSVTTPYETLFRQWGLSSPSTRFEWENYEAKWKTQLVGSMRFQAKALLIEALQAELQSRELLKVREQRRRIGKTSHFKQ